MSHSIPISLLAAAGVLSTGTPMAAWAQSNDAGYDKELVILKKHRKCAAERITRELTASDDKIIVSIHGCKKKPKDVTRYEAVRQNRKMPSQYSPADPPTVFVFTRPDAICLNKRISTAKAEGKWLTIGLSDC